MTITKTYTDHTAQDLAFDAAEAAGRAREATAQLDAMIAKGNPGADRFGRWQRAHNRQANALRDDIRHYTARAAELYAAADAAQDDADADILDPNNPDDARITEAADILAIMIAAHAAN